MTFTQWDRRRLQLYVGGLQGPDEEPGAGEPQRETVVCGACETRSSVERRYADRFPKGMGALFSAYIRQAQALFCLVDPKSCFAVCAADNRSRFSRPTIVKSRLVSDRDSKAVLLPLDRDRHWNELLHVASHDRPFDEKDDRLVWRGATTGVFSTGDPSVDYSPRFYVALQDFENPGIDLKYSKLVQLEGCIDQVPIELIRAHHDPVGLTLKQQLASKFLLCLEGNDVATGLKWMMASNSTVIMPAPTCETWFCEGELVPWEHYVPVSKDLSNIEEIYGWCMSNKARCREIAENGKMFVARFLNGWKELDIIKSVVGDYIDNSNFDMEFPRRERVYQYGNRVRLQLQLARVLMNTRLMRKRLALSGRA